MRRQRQWSLLETSAGCVCLFSIASTIVLEPREARRPWAIYSSVGTTTPVQQLALNLGAPGDRKDAYGTVWLSYPRYAAYPETSLDVKLDLQPQFSDGGGYQNVNEDSTIVNGAETPWLYTSWAQGLKELTLPLLGKATSQRPFQFSCTLRMHEKARQTCRFSTFSSTVKQSGRRHSDG